MTAAPPVGTEAWWKNPERVVASSDPDTATAQTIAIMSRHVRHAATDGQVQHFAGRAVQQFSGMSGLTASNDYAQAAAAAWWWCKLYIKFVHHELILRARLGEANHLQGLITPDALVRMAQPTGDCAIFSECLAAFLAVYGVPFEFVTVAANPAEPDIFSHVYVYAVMPDGSRLPLDASHGPFPGWQVPTGHTTRRQVWNAAGEPVADLGARFDGLHHYGLRGMGGFGDVITLDDGTTIDMGAGSGSTGDYFTDNYTPTAGFVAGGLTPAASPSSGFNWGSTISNLLNQWTKIGGQVIAPTVSYTRDKYGNLVYSAPAGSASSLPALSSVGSSPLVWLAVAAGLFLVVGMKK